MQSQDGRSLSFVVKVLSCVALGAFTLTFLATSFVSFETIRGLLDRQSADGSADPFTHSLYLKLIVALRFCGILLGLLTLLTGFVPIPAWLKLWKNLELHKRIRSSLRWWRVISHRELGCLAGMTLLGAVLRFPYLNDPIRYDEAHTYLSYAKYPWYVIISLYNDPNNHILHTLLVRLSTSLFGNAEWVIRFPAFFAGVTLVPLTFLSCRAVVGRQAAIAASSIVAVSSALIEYSVLGRGYSIICCCTMLNLIFSLRILKGAHGIEWGLMTLSSTLGMWTVPVMAYPNFMIWGWLLLSQMLRRSNNQTIKVVLSNWIFWVNMTCVLTVCLYLPVILTAGLESLSSQGFHKPISVSEYFVSLFSTSEVRRSILLRDWSMISCGGLVFTFLAGLLHGLKVDRQGCLAASIAGTGCLLLIFWQRILPPARVALFLIPLVSLPIGLGFSRLCKNRLRMNQRLLWCLWFTFIVGVPITNQRLRQSVRNSKETGICPEAEAVVERLNSEKWFRDNDSVPLIAVSPASAPIVYYAEQSGVALQHFLPPNESSLQDAVLIVSHLENQRIEEILGQLSIAEPQVAQRFQLWKRLQTVTLYRFEK